MRLFDLAGRVAAVVGGTGVLGGAICHGLGAVGAAVAVLGRSAERATKRVSELEAKGVRAVAILVDATDRESLESARRQVEGRFGGVDILVNGAGIDSSTPFFDITLEE